MDGIIYKAEPLENMNRILTIYEQKIISNIFKKLLDKTGNTWYNKT